MISKASSKRYPPKFFRLAIFLFVSIVALVGCGRNRSELELPAPLRSDFPYCITTSENWSWEAYSFECRLEGIMHRFVTKGISTPIARDTLFQKAVDQYRELISQTPIRCVVIERDEFQREVAITFAREKPDTSQEPGRGASDTNTSFTPTDGEFDIGLRMIELGLAKHDGTDFVFAERYREAETRARQAKLGIWQ